MFSGIEENCCGRQKNIFAYSNIWATTFTGLGLVSSKLVRMNVSKFHRIYTNSIYILRYNLRDDKDKNNTNLSS